MNGPIKCRRKLLNLRACLKSPISPHGKSFYTFSNPADARDRPCVLSRAFLTYSNLFGLFGLIGLEGKKLTIPRVFAVQ